MCMCLSVCLSVCVSVCMSQNVTLHYKTKTKKYKKLDFAGIVDYVTSNFLSEFESPIFISLEVIMGQKS